MQVIDDTIGHTLAAVSSLTANVLEGQESKVGATKDAAELVGKKLAELCLSKDIKTVFFDRGGFQYHGRIKVVQTHWLHCFSYLTFVMAFSFNLLEVVDLCIHRCCALACGIHDHCFHAMANFWMMCMMYIVLAWLRASFDLRSENSFCTMHVSLWDFVKISS